MGKKHFSEEQIAFALRQAESGTAVAEIIRKLGISEQALLPLEEAVRRTWYRRAAAASDLGGREPEAQAAGRGPQPRQEDVTGRALKKL